jgi:predicted GH43/DUF377 family glycosyl hydrolase
MSKTIFLLLGMLVSLFSAQTNWTKYTNNPVMTHTNVITELYAIGQPTVIKENDTFKMWYCGAGIDHRSRILYAYSIDGINWTKYLGGAYVLNIGSAGQWDSKWLDTPEIVQTPTGYNLYYFGDTTDTPNHYTAAIGLATSNNGVNWTKYSGNPVLSKGDSLSWEAKWIESPAVLYDNGMYKMWYTGVGRDWRIKIGYATSPDGVTWTKYAFNPVLSTGSSGSWDDMWVAVPAVIKHNNRYELWYSALSEADLTNGRYDTIRIGFAFSDDGINWTKYSGNPVLSTLTPPYNPAVDSNGPWAPDVVFDGSGYRMWYETAAGFCYATASLGIEERSQVSLSQPVRISPNPFKYFTMISSPNNFQVKIFDIGGNFIKRLNGHNNIIWDGKNRFGHRVSPGVYLLLVTSNNNQYYDKVIITE